MGIPEIVADKKEQIPALVAKYGAFNVHVFGSVANGTADDDNGIDFLVDMERTAAFSIWADC
jgi:predicted nucleotidyltransferase